MSDLTENSWTLLPASAFSPHCVVLVGLWRETSVPHMRRQKREDCFSSLHITVAILLWYYTKAWQGVFLKRARSVTLKPIGLSGTLNESFSTAWFCNFTHGSSGKYWFTEECRSSKCWRISLHDIKKKRLSLASSLVSSEKLLSFRMLSKSQWQIFFPKV